jgi:hypothetical protein
VTGDSGRSDDASSGLLVMDRGAASDPVSSSASLDDVVGDVGDEVASLRVADIDMGGKTGTGLGDGDGGTEVSVSCQKRTILNAISIFHKAWKNEKNKRKPK